MHKKAATDPGRELHLYSRIGMYNEIILSFFNGSGGDYNLSTVTLEVGIKKARGDADFITLTESSGITKTDNDAHLVITEAQSLTFTQKAYYWELRRTISGNKKVWLNGDHDWHNGRFDSFTGAGATITIDDNGTPVSIIINDMGGYVTRTVSATSTATLTPDIDNYDLFVLTAQAEALTIANPIGTPVNGDGYMIDVTDNGVARAITFGNKYRGYAVALPTTTISAKGMKIVLQYDSSDDKYDLLNVINQL